MTKAADRDNEKEKKLRRRRWTGIDFQCEQKPVISRRSAMLHLAERDTYLSVDTRAFPHPRFHRDWRSMSVGSHFPI